MQNLRPSSVHPSPSASLKVKIILVCAGLLAGLLITEGLARVFHIGEIPAPRRVVYNGESQEWCCGPRVTVGGVHHYESNTTFEHCYSGTSRDYFDSRGCVTCHINRWGYRGRDFTIEKSAEVYRIVFLGDSFTFGEGTPEPFLFTTVLSRTLGDRHIGGRRIEVINLGIAGQDGAEELTTYAEFGRKLAADLVILQWNTNDVPLSDIQQDHFRLIGRRYRELFGNNPYRWSRLLTMFYFNMRLQTISRQIITITNEQAEKERDTFNSIGLLRSVVEADGAEFTVLDFPEIIRFNDYPYVTIVDLLKQYCQSHQIPLVDLLPALSTHRDRELWVHETDHHPNRIAHAIAVTELLKMVTPKLDQEDVPKKASK